MHGHPGIRPRLQAHLDRATRARREKIGLRHDDRGLDRARGEGRDRAVDEAEADAVLAGRDDDEAHVDVGRDQPLPASARSAPPEQAPALEALQDPALAVDEDVVADHQTALRPDRRRCAAAAQRAVLAEEQHLGPRDRRDARRRRVGRARALPVGPRPGRAAPRGRFAAQAVLPLAVLVRCARGSPRRSRSAAGLLLGEVPPLALEAVRALQVALHLARLSGVVIARSRVDVVVVHSLAPRRSCRGPSAARLPGTASAPRARPSRPTLGLGTPVARSGESPPADG